MNKNIPISTDEAGRLLWSVAKKGIDHLVERVLPKIAEVLNLNYEDYDQDNLRMESLYVCLWAATRALAKEKLELIESLHKAGLSSFEEKRQSKKRDLFYSRCDDYNEAWDEKSGGNQSILCIHILTLMFSRVDDQRDLVNFWAFIQLTNFVLSLMNAIIDLRKKINIKD